MIRRHVGIAVVLSVLGLGLGVVGCGDDETETSPTPQEEAGPDVSNEAGPDTKEAAVEAAPDVAPDQVEQDVQADVTPDVEPDTKAEADAPPPPPSGVIQVLTINDFHGQIDPVTLSLNGVTGYYGGIGYLSTYFNNERAANKLTLVLNGGDEVGASPTLSAYGTDIPDEPAVLSLNYLGLTASNLGNHNFDRGTAHLKKLMEIATYSYIGTNVDDTKGELGTKLVKPYKMIELGDQDPKIKVAVVGISNPETPTIVTAGMMGDVKITNPITAANAAIQDARAAGAHVVLASAHIGADTVDPNDPDKKKWIGPLIDLANNLQGVDFIQGGHTEAEFYQKVGTTWVAQGPARGHAYYKAKITVTNGAVSNIEMSEVAVLGKEQTPLKWDADAGAQPEGGTLNCSNSTCPTGFSCLNLAQPVCEKVIVTADLGVNDMIQGWKEGVAAKNDKPLGKIDQTMARDGKIERSKEIPLGDLIADAILDTYRQYGAQIAFMNGGGIRDSLPSAYVPSVTPVVRTNCSGTNLCDVFLGDIKNVLPFGNAAVMRKLTGKIIWQMLEHSVDSLPGAYKGWYQQIAGLKYTWQASANVGSRVKSVKLVDANNNETDILNDDSTEYNVIVNDFMNGGGDGFDMLKETVPTFPMGILADAVALYLEKKALANETLTSPCATLPDTPCRIIVVP